MKLRRVIFSPEARDDIFAVYDWISDVAGPEIASAYVRRFEGWCKRLDIGSKRGMTHDHIRPGLRILGFERRMTVAFVVGADRVTVLRVFYGGQDWEAEL